MDQVGVDKEHCDGDACRRVAREGGNRRRPAPGQRLCPTCRGHLAAGIRALPRLHSACGDVLGARAAGGLQEKVSGGRPSGLALNAAAAEARTAAVATLASWSGLLVRELGRPSPPRAVVPLADFLLTNVADLLSHPAVGDMSAAVARAVERAHRALDPEAVKRIAVGRCVASGCDGVLTVTVRAGRDGAGEGPVRCGLDPGHAWDREEWVSLRRRMGRRAGSPTTPGTAGWLAALDVASLWRTPVGTVYRLASEHGWRRVTRSGRTYYAEADVQGSFARRSAGTLQDR